ncbi:MAG: DNA ligase D [Fimbriimonadaceae bacterium]|nr:DNA ligase D [Fimbriimonadaceae bacterium]
MADKLEKYRGKRTFTETSEPEGVVKETSGHIYTVQEHYARQLHWDLRLEHEGVLLSWAVPKGPPEREGVRRLAVRVEDHPVDYATFAGEIPKGNYGAGKVVLWDQGTWQPIYKDTDTQLAEGKLEFTIHGQRLKGDFVLVRTKPDSDEWLWMKMRASTTVAKPRLAVDVPGPLVELPKSLAPMLCTRVDRVPVGDDWVHEIKWDGWRVLARCVDYGVEFRTRNDQTVHFSGLGTVLARWIPAGSVIDGEAVVFDEYGVSRFPLVQQAIKHGKTDGVAFVAFDAPFLQGRDIRHLPLAERKELLRRVLEPCTHPRLRLSDHHAGDGRELLKAACRSGLEGVVSKRLDSAYTSTRSQNWTKVRCEKKLRALVGGYTVMAGTTRQIGALVLGARGADGKLTPLGRVGTGFSDAVRSKLFKTLQPLQRLDSPFDPPLDPVQDKGVTYVDPEVMAEVQFLDWSADGMLRQAKFLGHGPAPAPAPAVEAAPAPTPRRAVKISSEDRVLDPSSGMTKGQVADYYAAVAARMLVHLRGRPLSLLRSPDGITDATFFQKHRMAGLGPHVHSVDVQEHGDDGPQTYMHVDDAEGLLNLVQMAAIEFHPWGSTVADLERPDTLVFDLDPAPDVSWERTVAAAYDVRDLLRGFGFRPLTKVTGGKGVHVVVPIVPDLDWDEAKDFCRKFAEAMTAQEPRRFVSKTTKSARAGKILIDYLRNGRGATAVAAYSLRARPHMPVAMPVAWEELPSLGPGGVLPAEAVRRVAEDPDPWADYEDCRVEFPTG